MKIMRPTRSNFNRLAMGVALCGAFISTLSYAQADASQSPVVTAADGSSTIVVRKGNNVREMAKRYARMHHIQFKVVLSAFLAQNTSAFQNGNPDVLIIGAPFVLPNPESLKGGSLPVADTATVPVAATTDKPSDASVMPSEPSVTQAVANVPAPAAPVVPAIADSMSNNNVNNNIDDQLPLPIWGICLLAVAVLMLLVKLFRRPAVETTENTTGDYSKNTASNVPPKVNVNLNREKIALHDVTSENGAKRLNESGDSTQSVVSISTSTMSVIHDQVPGDVTEIFDGEQSRAIHIHRETPLPTRFANIDMGKIDGVLQNLPVADAPSASDTQVEVVATPPVVEAVASGLDLDVKGFMRRFADHAPPPQKSTAFDYEEWLDRTHLQAWINQKTPEDVLNQALDAHEEGYDDIADHMLNDVLFRGDAEQCAMASRLRKAWNMRRFS